MNIFQESREKLEAVESLRLQGKFDKAESLCAALLSKHPEYFAGLHTMGLICADRGNLRRAADYLFRAISINPRSWSTLTALSSICLSLDAPEMAAQLLEQARSLNPEDPNVLFTLAELYVNEREFQLAIPLYEDAIKRDPSFDIAIFGLARAYINIGEYSQAAAVLERIIKSGRTSQELLFLIQQLRPATFDIDVLTSLEKMATPAGDDPVLFANRNAFLKASAMDQAGRHEEAWRTFLDANQLIFAHGMKEVRDIQDAEQIALKSLQGSSGVVCKSTEQGPKLLFVLGPSRSGKTTMEALVGHLEGVKRGFENPGLVSTIRHLFEDKALLTSWSFDNLPPQFLNEFRDRYLEDVERRAGNATVFTNTSPLHIHHAVHLARLVPNVRFVFLKRNKNDLMLRMFMRLYDRGNFNAYNLRSIDSHLEWYDRMIDGMIEKFPSIVRVVQYETMVENPGLALKIAADLCELAAPCVEGLSIGNDCGCAAPYIEWMRKELAN